MQMPGHGQFMLHSISERNSEYSVAAARLERLVDGNKKSLFTIDDGYADNFAYGEKSLKKLSNRAIIFLVVEKVGGINDWDAFGELTGKPLLGWEQIAELKKAGVRFGSHSLTHSDLTKLDDKELAKETAESKRILEERLGEPIEGFAYPYGYFNDRVISAVKKAGYKWAVTTSDSIWEGRGDPYRMRRVNISGLDPEWLTRAKLNGLYDVKAIWELPQLIWDKIALSLRKNDIS